MARRMRATHTGAGKYRGNRPHRPASQFLGCRRVPRHRQRTTLELRRVREAQEQMVRDSLVNCELCFMQIYLKNCSGKRNRRGRIAISLIARIPSSIINT